jgi:hypothetical protein
MENMNQHEPEMEFSAEELAQQKENMLNFYKESMPYIEAQLAYEQILLQIDEARFKRANIQMQYAMMMQGPEQEQIEDEREDLVEDKKPASKERKLKKQ